MNSTLCAAMTSTVHDDLLRHLLRADGQEDLCFALWRPSRGATRTTALIDQPLMPIDGERSVHGNASFSARYFERAIFAAIAESAGLAFLHSHPFPGWQGMSLNDVRAEESHAGAVLAGTGLPLLGLTVGTDGAWSARFWERVGRSRFERRWCDRVRVVGNALGVTYNDELTPRPSAQDELRRTISAWGEGKQVDLARLHIGVVGLGSVGGIVAEAIARMGIARISIIDFDRFEAVNRDRSLHARKSDVGANRLKVDVVADALTENATADGIRLHAIPYSVIEETGFRHALDCDILFSCVDRPWPRQVLNFIAYAHLIPVIDGGIRVNVNNHGELIAADWRAHTVGPGRRCLACIGQYDPADVTLERDGLLDDPRYIQGLPEDNILRRNENVFAFSLSTAAMQALHMLSMVVAPLGIANLGEQIYHFVPGRYDEPLFCACHPECAFPALVARGDHAPMQVTACHPAAERVRAATHRVPL